MTSEHAHIIHGIDPVDDILDFWSLLYIVEIIEPGFSAGFSGGWLHYQCITKTRRNRHHLQLSLEKWS